MSISDKITSFIKEKGFSFVPDPSLEGSQEFTDNGIKGWYAINKGTLKSGKSFLKFVFKSWTNETLHVLEEKEGFEEKDLKEMQKVNEEIEKERVLYLENKREEVKELMDTFWEDLEFTPEMVEKCHYLERKGVPILSPAKVRSNASGVIELLAPMYDVDGVLWNMQIITDKFKRGMEGGRISGVFCPLSPMENLGRNPILICEGLATGFSIKMSKVPFDTVVCFNAKNLETVAINLRRKYPRTPILVAGDNDCWKEGPNVGLEAANEAAKACWGSSVIPCFLDFDCGDNLPTDFNDLHLLAGVDEVKKQLEIKAKVPPYIYPLGYDDNFNYVTSSTFKYVCPIKDFTRQELIKLAQVEYWKYHYPMTNKQGAVTDYNVQDIMNDLCRKCQAKGVMNKERVRGRGMWYDKGRHIFHVGDRLFVDGEESGLQDLESYYIYEMKNTLDIKEVPLLTPSEFEEMEGCVSKFGWILPHHSKLFIGALVAGVSCGVLPWRPHAWLTAEAGTGKSTIMDLIVYPLFKLIGGFTAANATEASIRQTLKSDAAPVALDEFDTNNTHKNKMSGIIDFLRVSSSGNTMARGSAGGESHSYVARSSAIVAGINMPKLSGADKTRFKTLELKKSLSFKDWDVFETELHKIFTEDFFKRFVWTIYKRLCDYPKTLEIFKKAFNELFDDARFADQNGSLTATYWMGKEGRVPTLEEAKELVRVFVKEENTLDTEFGKEDSDTDAVLCFEYIKTIVAHRDKDSGVDATIGALLVDLGLSANKILDPYGIKVVQKNGVSADPSSIFIRRTSKRMQEALSNTEWYGDWCKTLSRLPGAEYTRMSSGMGVRIPMDNLPTIEF